MIRSFLGKILLADLAFLILAAVIIFYVWEAEIFYAFAAGCIFMSLLALIVYAVISRQKHQSMNRFMAATFGGMLIKLTFILGAVIGLYFLEFLHVIGFTLGVLISYIYKSVIEIQSVINQMKPNQPIKE